MKSEKLILLILFLPLFTFGNVNSMLDGCSGTASFTMQFDTLNCCWTFQNTTTNDCSQWFCIWDFGDGSAPYTTSQGQGTACHQYPSPGTYTVTLEFVSTPCHGGSGGICYGQQEVTIPELDLDWTVSLYNSSNVSCEGSQDGWIQLDTTENYTYVWPAEQNPFDSTQYGSYIDSLTEGIYFVEATAANGCTGNQSFELFEPNIQGNGIITEPNCYNFSDGQIIFDAFGGGEPYSYLWSNGDTTKNISNISAGNYQVTVTDTFNCSVSFDFIVGQPDSIENSFTSSFYNGFNVSCFNASDGFINITPEGGTQPYQFFWSNGSNTEDLTNIESGAYFLTLLDDNNCVFYDNFYLNQPSDIVSIIYSTNDYNGYDISCYNYNDGALETFISGGIAPYSLNWSNGNTSSEADNLFAGIHSVVIQDINGCIHNDTIFLSQPDSLVSTLTSLNNFNGYDISCYDFSNGAIDLNIEGGVQPHSFNWNNGSELEDPGNLSEGTYIVDIVDNNNCSTINQISLIDPPPYSLSYENSNYNGYNISCFDNNDGWINLSVEGSVAPYSFLWDNGSSTQNQNQLSDGNYTVLIVDANLCETTISTSLIEPTPLVSQLISQTNYNGYDISCFNFNDSEVLAIASGSVAPYTIQWNNDTNLNQFNLIDSYAGQQIAEITDLNGCIVVDTINLIEPSEINLNIISTNNFNGYEISCNGANDGQIDLSIDGGISPYEYSWNTGFTSQDPFNLSAGVYDVVITDLNTCTDSIQITLSEPSPLVQSYQTSDYNGFNISCSNYNDGWIDVDINGSVPPYTFNWNDGTIQEDNNMLFSGNYSVQIQDMNLCSTSIYIILTQPSPLVSDLYSLTNYNGYDISCNGYNDGAIGSTIFGSVPPYNLIWNTGQNSDTITNLISGTYSLQVMDLNNCILNDLIELDEPLALNSTIESSFDYNGYDISCFNYSNGGVDLTINGGVQPYLTFWNNGEALEDLNGITSGDYYVSILDQNNCPDSNQITLIQPTELVLNFNISDYNGFNISCNGFDDGTINTLVSGSVPPYTFEWNNGLNTQNLYLLTAENYTLEISDLNNCQIADSLILTEPNDFFVNLSYSSDTCSKGVASGVVKVTPEMNPYSYLWSNGEETAEVYNLSAGPNYVIVSDIYNCEKLFEFEIDNLPSPEADFLIEPQKDSLFYRINTNLNFIDQSTDSWTVINYWYWDFGDGNYDTNQNSTNSYNSIQDFIVTLTIENIHDCRDTIRKYISTGDFVIHFPNSFTPQGDFINEKFVSKGIGILDFEMTIYSRWGEKIYSINDINKGWDGTYESSGQKCQQGVYVYDALIRDVFGDIHRITGNVTLID